VLNSNYELISSNVLASNSEDRTTEEKNLIGKLEKGLRFSENQIEEKIANHDFTKKSNSAKSSKMGGFPTIGENNLIMLLINFADSQTTYTKTDFENYMNQQNYGTYGSFKDFYLDASYGLLNVTTTVSEWIQVPGNHDYYADNAPQMVFEALVTADATIDFSQFDNDNDLYVDGLAVIHQGPGQEATANTNDIWSHSWNLEYFYQPYQLLFDGVYVGAYTTQPEIYSGGISTIGVMCHEFGHNLGAPDFYDTNYETCGQFQGTGSWDLMAGGSWNLSGTCPANHNMWTKIYFNWVEPTILTTPQEVILDNAYDNQVAYIINTNTENEYFLLENRQQINFDLNIPGHGLIIYHVDENYIQSAGNSINACSHQGMYPLALGNINSATCPFPGAAIQTDFNDFSNPNSLSWAEVATKKPLSGISENEGIITFDFTGGLNNPANFNALTVNEGFDIEITWELNQNSNPVLIAYSLNYNNLGTPIDGTIYNVGDNLPDGGEVLYYGTDIQQILHNSLQQSAT